MNFPFRNMNIPIKSAAVAAVLSMLVFVASPQIATAEGHSMQGHVEIDGYRLNYIVEGQGDTQLLVIGSADYYDRAFSQALREKLQIAFVDHRGFAVAPEEQETNNVSLAKVIEDIDLLRKTLGWNQPIVLGHSGHAFMALEYAKQHPDNVSGVVLMNVSPSYGQPSQELGERAWAELVAPERKAIWGGEMAQLRDRIEAAPEDRFLLFMLAMGARSWFDASYDASGLWEGVPINLPAIDHLWGVEFAQVDITKGLAEFDRPVFLGLGLYDFLVPPASTWDPIRNAFPDLTVRVFAQSGHTPMLEQPEEFDAELMTWISEKVAN